MFSIKIPGQNSWPLVVPGADKRTATGLPLLTHINYMGVNSPLLFNFVESLLSEQKSNFVNKYPCA